MRKIKTYQDLKTLKDNDASEKDIMQFIRSAISEHQTSPMYYEAEDAYRYATGHNTEAENREKVYTDLMGVMRKNEYAPCHRIKTNLFKILSVQRVSYLLGNGVTLGDEEKKNKLGKYFDNIVYDAGYAATTKTVSYLYWNLNHVEYFDNLNFVPLYDESNAALRSGIRWWQVAPNKPLRATLYEEDGYTEYAWGLDNKGNVAKDKDGIVFAPKRSYKIAKVKAPNGETQIMDMGNYPGFPIVPMWANRDKISPFACVRDTINAIDENINSVNDDLTEAQIYWMFQGADFMDDADLGNVLKRIRENHVVNVGYGQTAEPKTINIPVSERHAELIRLKAQAYEDFQGFDIDTIKSGNVVNAQIEAAYEPLNHAADEFEYCVLDCLNKLFELIPEMSDESITFTRSMMSNRSETIQNAAAASSLTGADYAREKILTAFGDGDRVNEINQQIAADEADRMRAAFDMQMLQQQQKKENDKGVA